MQSIRRSSSPLSVPSSLARCARVVSADNDDDAAFARRRTTQRRGKRGEEEEENADGDCDSRDFFGFFVVR